MARGKHAVFADYVRSKSIAKTRSSIGRIIHTVVFRAKSANAQPHPTAVIRGAALGVKKRTSESCDVTSSTFQLCCELLALTFHLEIRYLACAT